MAQRAISYGQVVSVSTVEAGLCLRPKYAISVYSSSSAIFRMYRKITNCGVRLVYACTVTYIIQVKNNLFVIIDTIVASH